MTFDPDHYVSVDRTVSLDQQPGSGHNRWHPDIQPLIRVETGEIVALESRDAFDGQISQDSTIEDLLKVSLGRVHPMTGPVYVNGAEPGDVLEVHVHKVDPADHAFTVQGPMFGFLRDIFTENYLVRWRLEDGFATSDELPGVKIPGAPFMGLMGVAPSQELLKSVAEREAKLADTGVFVMQPNAKEAIPADREIATEALSSLPPREFGGNIDIKQLTAGSTLRLPVFVEGALFSTGDGHFSQGDCECCTAIEMGATLYCSFNVVKDVAKGREICDPEFYRSVQSAEVSTSHLPPTEARPYFATTGFCKTDKGVNGSEDLNLAARNALINMIGYLTKERGLTREQAYALCSVTVDMHISAAVNLPNFLVSAFVPTDIFMDS